MASKKEDFLTKMQLLKVSCSNAGGKILDLVWGPKTHWSNVSFLKFVHCCASPVKRNVGTNSIDLKNRSFLGLRLLSSLTLPNTVRWRVWSPRNGRLSWCSLGPTVELLQSPGLFSTCQNYCVFIIFIDFGTSVNSGLLSASAMLSTSGIEQWESRRWSSSRGSAPKLLGSILDSSSRGSDAKWLDSISSSCNTRSSSVHMVEANAMSHQAGTSIDQRLITFPKVHQTHCLGIEGFQSLHGGKERKLLALWMSNSSCCKMMSLL